MTSPIRVALLAFFVALGIAGLFAFWPSGCDGGKQGFVAYQRGDYATAFRIWRPLADKGQASAAHNLGLPSLRTGRAAKRHEAAQWFRRAAGSRFARAQVNLGAMYAAGKASHAMTRSGKVVSAGGRARRPICAV
jgi:TPR repeat protein